MAAGSVLRTRAKKLGQELMEDGLGGVIIVPGPNMRYLTGLDSLLLERPFMLFVTAEGEAHLVAPALESGPYVRSGLGIEVHPWTDSEGPLGAISTAAREARVKGNWGVEGRAPFGYLDRLMTKASVKVVDSEALLQRLREVKDDAEVALLKKSGAILSAAFEDFPELIRRGATEVEVAKAATDAVYSHGATKVDDMLVQAGPMAADPHHLPSERKLAQGDSVVVDVGSTYRGYYADITRTFCIGRSIEAMRVYEKVLEAQTDAIDEASDGVTVGHVDRAARSVLGGAGMGANFFHRTGHGLGLEIHEEPYIVEGGKKRLRKGMCFTVEPGAYFSGKLGVRIEDDVLMEGRQGSVITDTPKEFGWWK